MDRQPIAHRAGYTGEAPVVFYDSLVPAKASGRPIVMLHGGAHTASCYLVTADGRPGWAYEFAARGHRVTTPDWPGTGRSAKLPYSKLTGEVVCAGLANLITEIGEPVILMTHSMSGAYGWHLTEMLGSRIAAVVGIAPSPPGNIQSEPKLLRRDSEVVEVEALSLVWKVPLKEPLLANDSLVNQKLVGASTRFPRDHLAHYRATLQPLPPRLLYERQNIEGSQMRVRDTTSLRGKPVLIVTGTDDIDHPRDFDGKIAEWLTGAGAKVDYWFLSDKGITGNGHMMMLESNSNQIAALIAEWLAAKVG
jgi:pimeloyl-ACP methyl ester carboxylesterase